jgi:hypothetical protein
MHLSEQAMCQPHEVAPAEREGFRNPDVRSLVGEMRTQIR